MAKPRSKRRHGKSGQAGREGRSNPASRQSELSLDRIASVKVKLESNDASERLIGLTSINALMAGDETYTTRSVFTEGIDKYIWKLATDPVNEVRAESLGFLRNAYSGSNGILIKQEQMLNTVNENIALYSRYFDSRDDHPSISPESKQAILECCESILAIVSSIASLSEQPPQMILEKIPAFPGFLLGILSFCAFEKYYISSSLMEVAMEAALAYSDVRVGFTDLLDSFDFETLKQSTSNAAVKAYVYSYVFNVSQQIKSSSSNSAAETFVVSLTNLIASLDIDDALNNLEPNITENISIPEQERLLKKANNARSIVLAVEVSLESITGVFESLQQTETTSTSTSVGEFLLKSTLPQIERTLAYDVFMMRSLSALNNLIWTLDTYFGLDNPEWTDAILRLWSKLCPKVPYFTNNRHAELQSILGCLWGLAKTSEGNLPIETVITEPSGQNTDIVTYTTNSFFTQYCRDYWNNNDSSAEIQHVIITTIHFLSQLARVPNRIELTSQVVELLLSLIMANDDGTKVRPVVIAEALSDFFDIFADKSYSYDRQLFVEAGLLKKLAVRLESLDKISRSIRDLEEREVFDEALENLNRFLEYKEEEQVN